MASPDALSIIILRTARLVAVISAKHLHRQRSARVLICRGCCCGTARKHPDVDHDAQRAALQSAAPGAVRTVGCLGHCERSNVIVIKRPHERSIWLGRVLAERDTHALCKWLTTGIDQPLPRALEPLVFSREPAPILASTPVTLGRAQ